MEVATIISSIPPQWCQLWTTRKKYNWEDLPFWFSITLNNTQHGTLSPEELLIHFLFIFHYCNYSSSLFKFYTSKHNLLSLICQSMLISSNKSEHADFLFFFLPLRRWGSIFNFLKHANFFQKIGACWFLPKNFDHLLLTSEEVR